MARTATLTMSGKSYSVGLNKLDRKKIYGWSKIDIFDDSDQGCTLASIADGQYVLPSGSITLAGFNPKGEYIAKSSLIGVDEEGKKVEKVPSVFDESALTSSFWAAKRGPSLSGTPRDSKTTQNHSNSLGDLIGFGRFSFWPTV